MDFIELLQIIKWYGFIFWEVLLYSNSSCLFLVDILELAQLPFVWVHFASAVLRTLASWLTSWNLDYVNSVVKLYSHATTFFRFEYSCWVQLFLIALGKKITAPFRELWALFVVCPRELPTWVIFRLLVTECMSVVSVFLYDGCCLLNLTYLTIRC